MITYWMLYNDNGRMTGSSKHHIFTPKWPGGEKTLCGLRLPRDAWWIDCGPESIAPRDLCGRCSRKTPNN